MKRLKIYVCGPYSDDNVLGVLKNIGRGEYWAARLFQDGLAPFTPWHDKTFVIQNWRDNFDVNDFYDYSTEWLSVSDALFIVPNEPGLKNWQDSIGTVAEIAQAEKLGIIVFYDYKELIKFKLTLDFNSAK